MTTPIFRAGPPVIVLWSKAAEALSTRPIKGVTFLGLAVLASGMLAGCGSVSEVTKDRVQRSETSLQQAEQTVGRSEAGAVELQRSKNNLEQAKAALNKKDAKTAERFAQLAQLDAELAVAKSQSASARKAADELLASIQTLRQEAARGVVVSDQ